MVEVSVDLTGQNGCAKLVSVNVDFIVHLLIRVVAGVVSVGASDYSNSISGGCQAEHAF